MKCPKCELALSSRRDTCPRCGLDLRQHKKRLGIRSARSGAAPARDTANKTAAAKQAPQKRKKRQAADINELADQLESMPDGSPASLYRSQKPKDDVSDLLEALDELQTPGGRQPQASGAPEAGLQQAPASQAKSTPPPSIEDVLGVEQADAATDESIDPADLSDPLAHVQPTAEDESAGSEDHGFPADAGEPEDADQYDDQDFDEDGESADESLYADNEPEPAVERPLEQKPQPPAGASGSSRQNVSLGVSPEVLDLSDADELLEEKLDEMIGDLVFDVEAVPEARRKLEPKAQDDATTMFYDDMEISFEIEVDGEDLDDDEEDSEPSESSFSEGKSMSELTAVWDKGSEVQRQAAAPQQGDEMMSGLMASLDVIESQTQQKSIASTETSSPTEVQPQQFAAPSPAPAPAKEKIGVRKLPDTVRATLRAAQQQNDPSVNRLAKLLAEAYGVDPEALLTEESIDSLQDELEDELSALMGEGNSFYSVEQQPELSDAPPQMVSGEDAPAQMTPTELQILEEQLNSELAALKSEGLTFYGSEEGEAAAAAVQEADTSAEMAALDAELNRELESTGEEQDAPHHEVREDISELAAELEADLAQIEEVSITSVESPPAEAALESSDEVALLSQELSDELIRPVEENDDADGESQPAGERIDQLAEQSPVELEEVYEELEQVLESIDSDDDEADSLAGAGEDVMAGPSVLEGPPSPEAEPVQTEPIEGAAQPLDATVQTGKFLLADLERAADVPSEENAAAGESDTPISAEPLDSAVQTGSFLLSDLNRIAGDERASAHPDEGEAADQEAEHFGGEDSRTDFPEPLEEAVQTGTFLLADLQRLDEDAGEPQQEEETEHFELPEKLEDAVQTGSFLVADLNRIEQEEQQPPEDEGAATGDGEVSQLVEEALSNLPPEEEAAALAAEEEALRQEDGEDLLAALQADLDEQEAQNEIAAEAEDAEQEDLEKAQDAGDEVEAVEAADAEQDDFEEEHDVDASEGDNDTLQKEIAVEAGEFEGTELEVEIAAEAGEFESTELEEEIAAEAGDVEATELDPELPAGREAAEQEESEDLLAALQADLDVQEAQCDDDEAEVDAEAYEQEEPWEEQELEAADSELDAAPEALHEDQDAAQEPDFEAAESPNFEEELAAAAELDELLAEAEAEESGQEDDALAALERELQEGEAFESQEDAFAALRADLQQGPEREPQDTQEDAPPAEQEEEINPEAFASREDALASLRADLDQEAPLEYDDDLDDGPFGGPTSEIGVEPLSYVPASGPAVSVQLWQALEQEALASGSDEDFEVELTLRELVEFRQDDRFTALFDAVEEEVVNPQKLESRRNAVKMVKSEERKVKSKHLESAVKRFSQDTKKYAQAVKAAEAETAERMRLERLARRAPLYRRVLAGAVDFIVSAMVGLGFCWALFLPPEFVSGLLELDLFKTGELALYGGKIVLAVYAAWILFPAFFSAAFGETLGGRWFRLQIVAFDGEVAPPSHVLLRNLAKTTTLFTLGLGLLPAVLRKPGLHDWMSGTVVLKRS